jgi:hypothetical protein
MRSLKEWFKTTFPEDLPRRARAERRHVPGLGALHWVGKFPGTDDVKDISVSGVYIKTNERWPPGEVNSIRLLCDDIPESDPDHDIELQAKAVRWGEDGMGLSFILPTNMETWLWRSNSLAEAAEVVHEFRVARALAFLKRVCPTALHDLDLLFREGLSNIRIRHSIEIALRAEEILAGDPRSHRLQAPKEIVLRITENGSWSDSELTQGLWAGLLATACKMGRADDLLLEFIDTLSEMATMHSRIFTSVCVKSTKVFAENGSLTAAPHVLTASQLEEAADAHDLLRVDRNLTQLFDLGLIEKREKTKYFTLADNANITPTARGLEMYARCHGFVGPVHEFYGVSAPDSPVVTSEK